MGQVAADLARPSGPLVETNLVHRIWAQSEAWSKERQSAIEELTREEIVKQGIPGLSLAVVLENKVAATPDTVYRIASASKPITATAAMQLYERGKLDLDAPVQRYVPQFPQKTWPVTSRHLLQHTAGIRHYRETRT